MMLRTVINSIIRNVGYFLSILNLSAGIARNICFKKYFGKSFHGFQHIYK